MHLSIDGDDDDDDDDSGRAGARSGGRRGGRRGGARGGAAKRRSTESAGAPTGGGGSHKQIRTFADVDELTQRKTTPIIIVVSTQIKVRPTCMLGILHHG